MKKYIGPNGEQMTVVSLDELPPISPERLAEIAAHRDEDIDFSDIPNMADDDDEFWDNGTIGWPPPSKVHLTMRLDSDIVEYFKRNGRGYQSRINAVLRSYMRAQMRAETERAAITESVTNADKTSS